MIPVKQIAFNRAEGLHEECGCQTFTSWSAVHDHVLAAACTAPLPGDGVNKCDVVVEWTDGATWAFRFELERPHAAVIARGAVSTELASELRFWSGLFCPPHMQSAQYVEFVASFERYSPGIRVRAGRLLEGHDLGLATLTAAKRSA